MIRLSSLADYAVVVMTAAAREGARVSSGEIARATRLPEPTVARLMSTLARGGLLASARGVAGGYALAKKPREISVADIVEAVDGPISLTACAHERLGDCAHETGCAVRPHWPAVNRAVRGALDGLTLAEIAGVRELAEA